MDLYRAFGQRFSMRLPFAVLNIRRQLRVSTYDCCWGPVCLVVNRHLAGRTTLTVTVVNV